MCEVAALNINTFKLQTYIFVAVTQDGEILRQMFHQGPFHFRTEACRDPQALPASRQNPRDLPKTRSTHPGHQGDDGRGRGLSGGGTIMNSCCGRWSAGGCQANTSTWSPLVRRATQRKALLRGLLRRLPAGPPCHLV